MKANLKRVTAEGHPINTSHWQQDVAGRRDTDSEKSSDT